MDTQPSTSDTSLKTLLTRAWHLYGKHYKLLLTIVLFVSVPLHIINTIIAEGYQFPAADTIDSVWDYSVNALASAQSLAIVIIALLGGVLAPLAIAIAIRAIENNKPIDYKQAFQKAIQRWTSAIITLIIMGLCLIVLYIALVIPGIIFTVFWSFAVFAVALNYKNGFEALRYSKSLVTGKWWKVFGYLIVFGLLSLVAGIVATLPLLPYSNYVMDIIRGIVGDIINSYFIVVMVLWFFQLEKSRSTA